MSDTPSLGQRWLAACADLPSGGWACGMLLLPEPDSPEGERDLESGITTEPGGPARVVSARDGCVTVAWEAGAGCAEGGTLLRGDVPDFADDATIGAALGVLRAWSGEPRLRLHSPWMDGWQVLPASPAGVTRGVWLTEAGAIVAAAEALAAGGGR